MVSEGAVCEHVVVLGVEEEKVVEVDGELEVFMTGRIPAPGCVLSAASMISSGAVRRMPCLGLQRGEHSVGQLCKLCRGQNS